MEKHFFLFFLRILSGAEVDELILRGAFWWRPMESTNGGMWTLELECRTYIMFIMFNSFFYRCLVYSMCELSHPYGLIYDRIIGMEVDGLFNLRQKKSQFSQMVSKHGEWIVDANLAIVAGIYCSRSNVKMSICSNTKRTLFLTSRLSFLSLFLFRFHLCCVVRNGIAWRTNRQWLQQTVMTTNEYVCRCVHKRDDHTVTEQNVKCSNSMREFSVWMMAVLKPYECMRPVVFRKWRPVNRVLCACVKWKH